MALGWDQSDGRRDIVLEHSDLQRALEALARMQAPRIGGGKGREKLAHEWPRKTIRYGEGRTLSGSSSSDKARESSHLQRALGRYARILAVAVGVLFNNAFYSLPCISQIS